MDIEHQAIMMRASSNITSTGAALKSLGATRKSINLTQTATRIDPKNIKLKHKQCSLT